MIIALWLWTSEKNPTNFRWIPPVEQLNQNSFGRKVLSFLRPVNRPEAQRWTPSWKNAKNVNRKEITMKELFSSFLQICLHTDEFGESQVTYKLYDTRSASKRSMPTGSSESVRYLTFWTASPFCGHAATQTASLWTSDCSRTFS